MWEPWWVLISSGRVRIQGLDVQEAAIPALLLDCIEESMRRRPIMTMGGTENLGLVGYRKDTQSDGRKHKGKDWRALAKQMVPDKPTTMMPRKDCELGDDILSLDWPDYHDDMSNSSLPSFDYDAVIGLNCNDGDNGECPIQSILDGL
jgi:hypothetical protein